MNVCGRKPRHKKKRNTCPVNETLYNRKLRRNIKKITFPDNLKYTYINVVYLDFTNKFITVINSVAPIKKVRVNANSKPWFDSEIISAIQKRNKLYSSNKKSGLETGKDECNTLTIFLQKMLHRKKNLVL